MAFFRVISGRHLVWLSPPVPEASSAVKDHRSFLGLLRSALFLRNCLFPVHTMRLLHSQVRYFKHEGLGKTSKQLEKPKVVSRTREWKLGLQRAVCCASVTLPLDRKLSMGWRVGAGDSMGREGGFAVSTVLLQALGCWGRLIRVSLRNNHRSLRPALESWIAPTILQVLLCGTDFHDGSWFLETLLPSNLSKE